MGNIFLNIRVRKSIYRDKNFIWIVLGLGRGIECSFVM